MPKSSEILLSLDTEATGLDLMHGARPFFITTCDQDGNVRYWEADVDPLTRRPQWDTKDLVEVEDLFAEADQLILQNPKFDVRGLETISCCDGWDWSKTHDTLMAGHLLVSNQPHDLTTMAMIYLRVNIQPLEDALEIAVKEAQKIAKRDYPEWQLAKKDRPDMPSAKDKTWKYDSWLPRAVAKAKGYAPDHNWWHVLADYGNGDSSVTLPLFQKQRALLEKKGLWRIYEERIKLLPVIYQMESNGMTMSQSRLEELYTRLTEEAEQCRQECVELADGEIEDLPVNGMSNALRYVLFEKFGLQSTKKSKKTGQPSGDKFVLDHWLATLPEVSNQWKFVNNLRRYRKRKTAIGYMDSYRKFWLPIPEERRYEVYDENEQTRIDRLHDGESNQDGNLLDMEWSQAKEGIRSALSKAESGGTESSQGELQTVCRRDPRRIASSSQVRQSILCKSGTPISRNEQGQLTGHGQQAKAGGRVQKRISLTSGTADEGKGSSELKIDRRSGKGDLRELYQGEQNSGGGNVRKKVWCNKDHSITSYEKEILEARYAEFRIVYPSYLPTGTDTLRFSSQNPNAQQVSKQEETNTRYCYGPAPGREWWSIDFSNLELRIPAYESGEDEMVFLFEHPNDPPYFGSYHMMIFDTLHPDLFNQHGMDCKKVYESTWYQWTKNGNFAVQYGAVESSGTADKAYHVPGAQRRIMSRFTNIKALSRKWIDFANSKGYIETMPDKTVDPTRGYPLYCTRTDRGTVLETVPLSYHVQGTAMWITMKAMIRVQEFLNDFSHYDGMLIGQIHDEMLFDFPVGVGKECIEVIKDLMLLSGTDVGVPLEATIHYHPVCWAHEEKWNG